MKIHNAINFVVRYINFMRKQAVTAFSLSQNCTNNIQIYVCSWQIMDLDL